MENESKEHSWNCSELKFDQVKKRISKGRAVLGRLKITPKNYKTFRKRFECKPKGILKSKHLKPRRRKTEKPVKPQKPERRTELQDHAFVVVGTIPTKNALVIKNSEGPEFADDGYCRVHISAAETMEMQFLDVTRNRPLLDYEDKETVVDFDNQSPVSYNSPIIGICNTNSDSSIIPNDTETVVDLDNRSPVTYNSPIIIPNSNSSVSRMY